MWHLPGEVHLVKIKVHKEHVTRTVKGAKCVSAALVLAHESGIHHPLFTTVMAVVFYVVKTEEPEEIR